MNKQSTHPQRLRESGVGVLEALAALVMFGLVALSLQMSLSTALAVEKITEAHNAASSLAASRIETLAALDPANVDSSYDEEDVELDWEGLSIGFLRTTVVTINADQSRTISVTVRSTSENIPTTVNFSTTFVLWE